MFTRIRFALPLAVLALLLAQLLHVGEHWNVKVLVRSTIRCLRSRFGAPSTGYARSHGHEVAAMNRSTRWR